MDAMLIEASDPARRLMLALGESQTQLTVTLEAAVVLQTRAPTGKKRGPVAGLLLSSPITFQVMGVTLSAAIACTGARNARASAYRMPAVIRRITWSPYILALERAFIGLPV